MQLVRGIVGLLMIAAILFHIYMGAVGEEGALEGMWDGIVDENWGKQHHSIWYDREVGKGNVPVAPRPKARCSPPSSVVWIGTRAIRDPRGCLRPLRRAVLPLRLADVGLQHRFRPFHE